MTKQEIEFRDPVVQSVVNKFVDRSDVGFAKYGKTMRDDNSDVFVWLNHLQEELMDATLYLQRLKEEITDLREEKALLREINEIDVIDAFEIRVKKNKSKNALKNSLKNGNGPGPDEKIKWTETLGSAYEGKQGVKNYGSLESHFGLLKTIRLPKKDYGNKYSIEIDD
jgi:hypothetical protein